MSDPNIISLKSEAIADTVQNFALQDLSKALGSPFRVAESGCGIEGKPTLDTFRHGVSILSAFIDRHHKTQTAYLYMLGDVLLAIRLNYGPEAAEQIIQDVVSERGVTMQYILTVERVCGNFSQEQRLPVFTAQQELLRAKGKLSEDQFTALMEDVRDGPVAEVTLGDGTKTTVRKTKPCSQVRAMVSEALGKPPKTGSTFRDPTGDSVRLRLAEQVVREVQEMRERSPDLWSSVDTAFLKRAISAYEKHLQS